MANKWLVHVRKTLKLKKIKGQPFGAVIKAAKKTYKARGGSAHELTPPDVDNKNALPPDGTKSPPLAVQGKDAYGSVVPTQDIRGGRSRRRRSRHSRK
jgi:hypothetical protein